MSAAKAALEALSGLLLTQGIIVDAELLRQAKFNQAKVKGRESMAIDIVFAFRKPPLIAYAFPQVGVLWRALHDLVLLHLWHPVSEASRRAAQRGLRELWRDIELEAAAKGVMPADGE